MKTTPLRVAILGAGPAGSALSILLARRGAEVTLFDDDRRPELLVGESLVPAAIPILKTLGLEEEMKSWSRVKPGVTFIWSPEDRFSFTFARFAPAVFPYAYNIPRPTFDGALASCALRAGVTRVVARARLQRAPHLEGRQPDLIVDATGRARHSSHVLDIPARVGPRKDVAHFAHFEGFRWDDEPGQVLIARRDAGWSWCIPLQERLSVGIVLGQDDAAQLGRSPEERLSAAVAKDPWLSSVVGSARRVTPVATYANYQLIAHRAVGPGWVAIGDAFGFVDPMLSPGVFLSLRSAELVTDALTPMLARRTEASPARLAARLRSYGTAHGAALSAWLALVEQFYDGRVLALMRAGRDFMATGSGPVKKAVQRHIERHIGLQASGAGTTRRYSRALLQFLGRYGLRGVEPADYAIR